MTALDSTSDADLTEGAAPTVPMAQLIQVDRSSPVPMYYQIAQCVERAIESGQLPPGTQLETEIALAAELGLSRPTMRQAMQYLVDKGLIVRRRGIGTRVVQPKVRRPLELSSLFDDLTRGGQTPTTRVLSATVGLAPPDVTTALGIAKDARVLSLVRLRSAGDLPIARLTNYLPAELLSEDADKQLVHTGLYQLIRTAGVQLHSASQSIGARIASWEEANLLEEDAGAALLTMERIAYDDHGTVVEYGTHIYAASRYSFEMSLLHN